MSDSGWHFTTLHEEGRRQILDDADRRAGPRPSRVQRIVGLMLLAGALIGWAVWGLFL